MNATYERDLVAEAKNLAILLDWGNKDNDRNSAKFIELLRNLAGTIESLLTIIEQNERHIEFLQKALEQAEKGQAHHSGRCESISREG